jgi:hypothetical protein
MLELATVKKLLPKSHRTLITQEFLDRIEESVTDSAVAEQVKENFITYLNVLSKGRYKMEDYLSAVKYISFKLLGYSNIDAYAATFPERYARLVREGQQKIDAFVAMYNKNKLVTQIYEQTMVPTYVLNAPLHQEALNALAEMIRDPSVRGMTKVKACDTILQHTKQPEVVKGELSINIDQQDTIADLRDVTEKLAQTYRKTLESGYKTLKEVSEAKIIDVEYDTIEEDLC